MDESSEYRYFDIRGKDRFRKTVDAPQLHAGDDFLIKGNYYQVSSIVDELQVNYPALKEMEDPAEAVNALLALISYARTGSTESLRPFLNVQVQLWMRELRRLVAKVSPKMVTYSIAHDLNTQQAKQYLPVVNCRDCGATGWTSILSERMNATITSLEAFYNLYFKADEKIVMMFPHKESDRPWGFIEAQLCPECLQVKIGEDASALCDNCGADTVKVLIPNPIKTSGSINHKQFVCPFCGSKRGISLMGLRSATEISTSISQLFASKFNDDKKTLAFLTMSRMLHIVLDSLMQEHGDLALEAHCSAM